jgi:hypothetical protein
MSTSVSLMSLTLAKALTDPSLTLEQKQQLAKELVSGVTMLCQTQLSWIYCC